MASTGATGDLVGDAVLSAWDEHPARTKITAEAIENTAVPELRRENLFDIF